ncbi:MAG: phosphoglycolate phosphatase [Acetobacteraceae bacterium]|nr:phosphoglycolate phosphatase [Acetobacteraceae bacterium]
MRRTVVFDLDGTLVDSAPDLAAALSRLMAARGLPGFGREEVIPMIGDGARLLLERAFAARGLPPDDAALPAFLADYEANAARATRPFPGIPEALEALSAAGWALAVCTNKPAAAARGLLAALGLQDAFAAILGGDSLPVRKPDPAHVLGAVAAAGGDPRRAAMVGDHANDMRAAAAAGIPALFCAWGYGRPDMAMGAPVARRAAELPGLLAAILPAA